MPPAASDHDARRREAPVPLEVFADHVDIVEAA
ncbi:MAG: hypothetical protein JWR08_44, partial [Enterovirga sp.]|nr:hypothetical protein [Enterovirga sp.]